MLPGTVNDTTDTNDVIIQYIYVFLFYSILLVELQIVGLFLVQTGIESFFWKTAALHPFDRFHPDLWNLKPPVSHLEDGEGVQTWSEVAGWPVYFVSCVRWCEAGCQDVCVCVCVREFCVLTYHWTLTINPDNLWTLKWGLLRICSEKSEPYLKLYCLSLSAVTTIEQTLCAGAKKLLLSICAMKAKETSPSRLLKLERAEKEFCVPN